MRKQLKTILYEILEVSDSTNFYSLADDVIITSLIFLTLQLLLLPLPQAFP